MQLNIQCARVHLRVSQYSPGTYVAIDGHEVRRKLCLAWSIKLNTNDITVVDKNLRGHKRDSQPKNYES